MGGRGGYKRLFKGHDIYQVSSVSSSDVWLANAPQVSDELKSDVSEETKEQARKMAQEELKRRIAGMLSRSALLCL